MSQEDLLRKINLLEEYSRTLQKQNFAKNAQTSLLYEQVKSMKEENQMLKDFIEKMKDRWEEEKKIYSKQNLQQSKTSVLKSRDFGQNIRNSVNLTEFKAVAEDMQEILEQRQSELAQLKLENDQKEKSLQCYQTQFENMTSRIMKSEQKIRKQLEIIKTLEEDKYQLKRQKQESQFSSQKFCSNSRMSFTRLEVDKLVKQNNDLIEKIRVLQKEKNGYYKELKIASPLKPRSSNLGTPKNLFQASLKKSNIKGEKWSMMEERLREIRNENERLKANLAID